MNRKIGMIKMKETVKIINDTYKLLKKTENIKDAKKLNTYIL